jgi:hypothetical protein
MGVSMKVAVRSGILRTVVVPVVSALILGVLLGACASTQSPGPVSLDNPEVAFPSGRIKVYLTDEDGQPMTRTRVDFFWQSPEYNRTSAMTDNYGQVSFAGVPEVAEVSIDHPGGNYTRTLVVPQRGTSELRVMLDTFGENQAIRRRQSTPVSQQRSQQ